MEAFTTVAPQKKSYPYTPHYFIFHGRELLLTQANTLPLAIPKGISVIKTINIGALGMQACLAVDVEGAVPKKMHLVNIRAAFQLLGEQLFSIAGRAYHLIHWERTNQYCGVCGNSMLTAPMEEHAKICSNCGHRVYPRISPAVIVAVTKGDTLLLAHATRFKNHMYSVIAGFVEPGESLEDCVAREVKEETNIEVKNIEYFGSQAWPFPDALMVGFTAQYASGELIPDGDEIQDAQWFHKSNFPEHIPGRISISRQLIDWFLCEIA